MAYLSYAIPGIVVLVLVWRVIAGYRRSSAFERQAKQLDFKVANLTDEEMFDGPLRDAPLFHRRPGLPNIPPRRTIRHVFSAVRSGRATMLFELEFAEGSGTSATYWEQTVYAMELPGHLLSDPMTVEDWSLEPTNDWVVAYRFNHLISAKHLGVFVQVAEDAILSVASGNPGSIQVG